MCAVILIPSGQTCSLESEIVEASAAPHAAFVSNGSTGDFGHTTRLQLSTLFDLSIILAYFVIAFEKRDLGHYEIMRFCLQTTAYAKERRACCVW